ncbi:MAG: biopolymer transporter ExbD [Verrucomicrobiaceae bacterium]
MIIPSPRPQKRARIEIIPLIDIMFFLLATFLMVSLSMLKNNGLTVRLPAAHGAAPQPREDAVTISIDADGALFYNKDRVTEIELNSRIITLKQNSGEPRVRIQGDERATLGSAISVLDIVRAQGIEKISILTRPADHAP